jgi:hypothetical protein
MNAALEYAGDLDQVQNNVEDRCGMGSRRGFINLY